MNYLQLSANDALDKAIGQRDLELIATAGEQQWITVGGRHIPIGGRLGAKLPGGKGGGTQKKLFEAKKPSLIQRGKGAASRQLEREKAGAGNLRFMQTSKSPTMDAAKIHATLKEHGTSLAEIKEKVGDIHAEGSKSKLKKVLKDVGLAGALALVAIPVFELLKKGAEKGGEAIGKAAKPIKNQLAAHRIP